MERNDICKAMKTIIEPKQHNVILTQWRGAEAKIWLFNVSHQRLALRLYKPGKSEVVYIVAVACEQMRGPFSWRDANISISCEKGTQLDEIDCHIRDESAGFELRCSGGVAMVCGPETDSDTTFENFLGDPPPEDNV